MTCFLPLLAALTTATALNAQVFTISEEDPPAVCPSGLAASSFHCTGDFCDDITFRCRFQSSRVAFTEWTQWVEHDGLARRLRRSAGRRSQFRYHDHDRPRLPGRQLR